MRINTAPCAVLIRTDIHFALLIGLFYARLDKLNFLIFYIYDYA